MRIFFTPQYVRFLAVGGVAALLHWLARIFLSLHLPYVWSVVISYFAGLSVAFVLNKIYVFPNSLLPLDRQLNRFFLVNVITMPLVWLTAIALERFLGSLIFNTELRQALAHGVAVTIPAVSSFIAYKFFAFK